MTTDSMPSVVMTELEAIQYALRPPKDPEELWWYVRIIFNVHIPRKSVCPDCDAPFDVFCAVYFNPTSEMVVVGARGTSKTVMVAILASVIMLTKRVDVSIIAGSKDQAQLVVKYLRNEDSTLAGKLWGAPNAPRALLDERTESKHQIRTLGTVDSPGNQIFAHAASETSIRGHHPTVVLYDEADVAEYADIDHSRGLAMEGAGGVKICSAYFSTWHKYGGTMSRLLDEFRQKERVFNRKYIYSWCWKEQVKSNGGFLSKCYIADKKAQLSEAQWAVEFDNKGPQSGTRIFDETMLKSLFQVRLGELPGVENQWYKFTDEPSRLARHYHGGDWARDLHWTVLHTLQKVNVGYQTVAWYRTNHKPYPLICGEVASHVKKWRGPLCHDETGVGKALDDILIVNEKLNRASVLPMDWSKQKLVKEAAGYYQYAVQNEEICGPHIQFAYSEHEYLTEDMLRGADHCPDSVAAAMMAYYVARVRHGARSSVSTILRVSV